MRRPTTTLTVLAAPLLLLGLAACGPEGTPEEGTEAPVTETTQPVKVSDGGGDDEVVQPTETTEYVEQGEGTEDG